jgi:hypothetical protein
MKLKRILKLLEAIEEDTCQTLILKVYTDKSVDLLKEDKVVGSFHDSNQLYNFLIINFVT